MNCDHKIAFVIIVVVGIALLSLSLERLIDKITEPSKPVTITVAEVNTTPKNYFAEKNRNNRKANRPEVTYEYDSVLHHAFLRGENVKWETEYRFAYELPEGSGFDWHGYLKTHPEDAVDGGLHCHVIFSNKAPDPKYFKFKEVASTN